MYPRGSEFDMSRWPRRQARQGAPCIVMARRQLWSRSHSPVSQTSLEHLWAFEEFSAAESTSHCTCHACACIKAENVKPVWFLCGKKLENRRHESHFLTRKGCANMLG